MRFVRVLFHVIENLIDEGILWNDGGLKMGQVGYFVMGQERNFFLFDGLGEIFNVSLH